MLASYKLHPLLLPEILSRVSLAIPAWELILDNENNNNNNDINDRFSDSTPPRYRFTPTTLIACSKVCRAWYSIFYPALWTLYDGHIMSPFRSSPSACYSSDEFLTTTTTGATGSRRTTYSIPDDTILANSDHIQTILNDHRRLFGRRHYECPKLTDITLYGTSPGLVHLVRSHGSQLRRLKWVGNVPFSGMLEDIELDCLETLTRVEELVLVQWDVSARETCEDSSEGDGCWEEGKTKRRGKGLIEVLAQTCSKTLRRLTLQHVQGLDDLPLDLDHFSSISGNSNSNVRDSSKGGRDTVLEQLEELVVDAEWAENQALIHFLIGQPSTPPTTTSNNTNTLTSFCPRLKRLDLGAGLLEDPEMMARLEKVLPVAHPGLARDMSIESRPWARYHQTCPKAA
ncbi:hypothetical protein BGZ89_009218 [Linnemannia elongata]|nr:hypothetical protein BGZ89_009218 [Linnemannia elongata]